MTTTAVAMMSYADWRGPTDELYGQRNAIECDPVGQKVEFFEYVNVGKRVRKCDGPSRGQSLYHLKMLPVRLCS